MNATVNKSKILLLGFMVAVLTIPPLRAEDFSEKRVILKTLDYKLDYRVDYESKKLYCEGELTVLNPAREPAGRIPLLLYRLLTLKSVTDQDGASLPFVHTVVSFSDWEQLQVNFIEVSLIKKIEKDEIRTIRFRYEGYLAGYMEAMRYVKDRIDKDYTVLRTETFAYPVVGYPSWRVNRAAGFQKFDYLLKVTVPDNLVVANGGYFLDKSTQDGMVTYSYRNIKPAWRIDAAITRYDLLESGKNRIFYFPEDSLGARQAMTVLNQTLDLFTEWFGPLQDYHGFSIIEVPDGYGSQADVTTILQTAGTFTNPDKLYDLYHEISHQWNVTALDPAPPRFESEGLAMLLQHRVQELLENKEGAVKQAVEKYINRVRSAYEKNPTYQHIPMIDHGKEDITDLSYTKGMLFFNVLYELMGEESFNQVMGSFYQRYYTKGATAEDFITHCKQESKVDLTRVFDDWIYGTKSSEYIMDGVSMTDIIKTYQRN